MKKSIKFLLVIGFIIFSATALLADPPGPPTGGNATPPLSNNGNGSGPVGAPLDGGLSILLLSLGAAYGGKMIRQRNQN